MQTILLNGKTYTLRPDKDGRTIRRTLLPQFANAFRPEGRLSTESVVSGTPFVFPVPSNGLGLSRIRDVSDPTQFRRMWDSTCETRWGQISLPLQEQDATEPTTSYTSRGAGKAFIEHGGNLFGFWSDDVGANSRAASNTSNGTSWNNNFVAVSNAFTEVSVLSACVHKTRRFVLIAGDDDIALYSSEGAAGTVWTIRGSPGVTANWPNNQLANAATLDENADFGLAQDYGNTLLVYYWDEDNGTIACVKSTDNGGTWTNALTTNVGSGNGPQGQAIYKDADGAAAPLVCTREGVYALDITNSVLDKVIDLSGSPSNNNGRGMCVWNDALIVPMGDGSIMRYAWSTSGAEEPVNLMPMGEDGFPADMQGYATWTVPTTDYLYVAYGGDGAALKASVFAISKDWYVDKQGKRHYPVHRIYQHGTANRKIDWIGISAVGGTTTMHIAVRTGTNATDMLYLQNPLTNPYASAVAGATSGKITRPQFDWGFPGDKKNITALRYDASQLSSDANGRYINIDYGLDGDAASTNDLGNILSGDKDLDFGSSLGVAAYSIAIQETFNRGSTALTVDSVGTATTGSGVSSVTVSHTLAGNNRLLVVLVSAEDATEAAVIPTGVTYGGVALTKLGDGTRDIGTGTEWVGASIWYLVAPVTGAADVVVTFSEAVNDAVVMPISFNGVHQTTPLGAMATASADGLSPSVAVTTTADDLVIDVLAQNSRDVSSSATAGAGQTERWDSDPGRVLGAGSTETATGASTTMSWTVTPTVSVGNNAHVLLGVAVKPVSGNTPFGYSYEITGKVRPAVLARYEFDLDVDLCARRAGSYSALDTELQALLPDTQIVRVALAYGIKAGSLGTRMVSKNVYVEDVRYRESVESDVPDGAIRVIVSEA